MKGGFIPRVILTIESRSNHNICSSKKMSYAHLFRTKLKSRSKRTK